MPDHLEPDQTPRARDLTREVDDFQLCLDRDRKVRFKKALVALLGGIAIGAGCVWLWGCSSPDGHGPFEVIQPHPKPVEDPPSFCPNGQCIKK